MASRKKPPASQASTAHPDLEQLNYEEVLERLEETVERLESGGLSMDEAIDAYELGAALASRAQRLLDGAEQRIRELREGGE